MTSRASEHPDLDLLLSLHLMGGAAVFAFGLVFLLLGHPVAAACEGAFVACLLGTYAWLRTAGRGVAAIATFHIAVVFLDITGITLSLGGLVASGGFMVWGIISPLAAMMFLRRRAVLLASSAYILLLALSWLIVPTGSWVVPLRPELLAPFTAANLAGGSLLALLTLGYFLGKLRAEQQRADNLLLNMLPAEIAEILKHRPGTIAEHHAGASILFADIVGFTPMCRGLEPTRVVEVLNEVFSRFDALAAHYGVEKIKTIGDCYMVAAGVPRTDPRHAELLTAMALEMVQVAQLTEVDGQPLQVRVGISSGPVVAGVIGQRKFIYDLWGDAVNLASRMESHGATDEVRVTEPTWRLIEHAFAGESQGLQTIKGVGEVAVWRISGWRRGVEPLPILGAVLSAQASRTERAAAD
jgi:adenylate cyclase